MPANAKRPPLVIVLAVVVPLLAVAVAAIVRTSTTDEGASTATTLVQDGAPGSEEGEEAASTTAPAAERANDAAEGDEGSRTTTTTEAERRSTEAQDQGDGAPTPPAAAGGEGDRPTVTYPQPTVPAEGCSRPSGTAVITLGEGPSPACLELAGDQPVVFRNRTGKDVSVVAIGLNEVVAAGTEARVGAARDAFGDGRSSFWSPGNPQLSGIVEVN